jgi:hypothetical protein
MGPSDILDACFVPMMATPPSKILHQNTTSALVRLILIPIMNTTISSQLRLIDLRFLFKSLGSLQSPSNLNRVYLFYNHYSHPFET